MSPDSRYSDIGAVDDPRAGQRVIRFLGTQNPQTPVSAPGIIQNPPHTFDSSRLS
jgi:hypothetical protein